MRILVGMMLCGALAACGGERAGEKAAGPWAAATTATATATAERGGGVEHAAYAEELRALLAPLRERARRLNELPPERRRAAEVMVRMAKVLRDTARGLRAIEPPHELRYAHADYTAAHEQMGRFLARRLAPALRARDYAEARRLALRLEDLNFAPIRNAHWARGLYTSHGFELPEDVFDAGGLLPHR